MPFYVRKTRDVPGNLPGLIGRLAPPPRTVPPDNLILVNRALELNRTKAEEEGRLRRLEDTRNKWKIHSDEKQSLAGLRERVAQKEQQYEQNLEMRRDILRCMLQQEESMLMGELVNSQETTQQRQATLRQRAQSLKERKERERQETARRLLDQQFKEQCEELRSYLSKRAREELGADHKEQIQARQLLSDRERAINAILDPALSGDMIARPGRDETDAARKHELECEAAQILLRQKRAIEISRDKERAREAEEIKRMEEERKLLAAEAAVASDERRRKALDHKELLRRQIRDRVRRAYNDEEQELAAELNETETAIAQHQAEVSNTANRKVELMAELQRYRRYLQDERERRRIEEIEIERRIQEDTDLQWKKRCEAWAKDRAARKALLDRVIKERAIQIAEKESQRRAEKANWYKERDEAERTLREAREADLAAGMRIRQKKDHYAHDLLGQIEYDGRRRCAEEAEKIRERLACDEADRDYQQRLADALADAASAMAVSDAPGNPNRTRNEYTMGEHPFRLLATGPNRLPRNMAEALGV